jgi:hypothetical protein
MLTWPVQLAILGFLAVVWTAQWLDWEAGIQEGKFDRRWRRRRV